VAASSALLVGLGAGVASAELVDGVDRSVIDVIPGVPDHSMQAPRCVRVADANYIVCVGNNGPVDSRKRGCWRLRSKGRLTYWHCERG